MSTILVIALLIRAMSAGPAEPVRFAPEDLGQDGKITLSPGFSPDGRFMLFAQSECGVIGDCPQRMKIAYRTETGWSTPAIIERTASARVDYPSVAPDGRTVLFSWSADRPRHDGAGIAVDFDLYRMDLFDEDAAPVPIDEPDISRLRGGAIARTRFVHNETAPVLTEAGDLYFWTERLEGPGERDVYVARSDGAGGFLEPEPLPAPINTAAREDGAWVTPDGQWLLVAMTGRPDALGDADLYVSRKEDDGWSAPVNLGPSVNSAYGDGSARITPDGRQLVFTSSRPFEGQAPGLLQVWTVPTADVPALAPLLAATE